jgi:hypothetical protein
MYVFAYMDTVPNFVASATMHLHTYLSLKVCIYTPQTHTHTHTQHSPSQQILCISNHALTHPTLILPILQIRRRREPFLTAIRYACANILDLLRPVGTLACRPHSLFFVQKFTDYCAVVGLHDGLATAYVRVRVCVCVCVCVCVRVHILVCMLVYDFCSKWFLFRADICPYFNACMHGYVCVCMYSDCQSPYIMLMFVCTCVCMLTCIYLCVLI